MSAPSQDDDARREHELVDGYMKHYFRVEVPGTEPAELDDDAKVDAYVRHRFPPSSD